MAIKKTITGLFVVVLFLCFFAGVAFASEVEERYIQYKGVGIYTTVYNAGANVNQAVLFLPGLGAGHESARFLHHPDNKHMTVTLDYLNHGNSGKVAEINWEEHLGSIKAVLDAYGIKKAYLVGHSFGADTAMMFALHYPSRVRDMVLIDRAYYNFADLEQFNFTRSLTAVLEYNPGSGLTYQEFLQYLEMTHDNDISATWGIKQKTLLISADPSIYLMLPELVAMIKMFPEQFGMTPEQVAALPDISEQDAAGMVNYIAGKAANFSNENHRFDVLRTPYPHAMIYDESLQPQVRGYVLEYLKNGLARLRGRGGSIHSPYF